MDYNRENKTSQRSKWKEKHFLGAKVQLVHVDELMGLEKESPFGITYSNGFRQESSKFDKTSGQDSEGKLGIS